MSDIEQATECSVPGRLAATMTAVRCSTYGGPEVLRVATVPRPCPKDDEVLVRVHAAVVGASDTAFRAGKPAVSRLFTGLRRPKAIPGDGFAGVVEAAGARVRRFCVGDRVFGSSVTDFGAHAQYLAIQEEAAIAVMPKSFGFDAAAALMDGATTALHFLRDQAHLASGCHVLVNGAAGAVGSAAVQLAAIFGAEVTAVCSGRNAELVRSLGASHVIDRQKSGFTATSGASAVDGRYDVVFDAVGKSSFGSCKPVLAAGGLYMSTVPSVGILLRTLAGKLTRRHAAARSRSHKTPGTVNSRAGCPRGTSSSCGKRALFAAAGLKQNAGDLEYLTGLADAGRLQAVIDQTYPLAKIAAAHEYVEQGHKTGSVVLQMPT